MSDWFWNFAVPFTVGAILGCAIVAGALTLYWRWVSRR